MAGIRAATAALARFPAVTCAFAYGSGAFPQPGYTRQPMIDLVLVVDDPEAWHAANLTRNARDYSSMRFAGARAVAAVQQLGCGAYYNPFVMIDGLEYKYGVATSAHVADDLEQWQTLFFAGRLHKPVAWLAPPSPRLASALARNLASALDVAALLLADRAGAIPERELYETVAGLSYRGDVRFALGAETVGKVAAIVSGASERFAALYRPLLAGHPALRLDSTHGCVTVDAAAARRAVLPSALAAALGSARAPAEVAAAIAARVGGHAQRVQVAKGVLSAGVFASARYGLAKLAKGRASRR